MLFTAENLKPGHVTRARNNHQLKTTNHHVYSAVGMGFRGCSAAKAPQYSVSVRYLPNLFSMSSGPDTHKAVPIMYLSEPVRRPQARHRWSPPLMSTSVLVIFRLIRLSKRFLPKGESAYSWPILCWFRRGCNVFDVSRKDVITIIIVKQKNMC